MNMVGILVGLFVFDLTNPLFVSITMGQAAAAVVYFACLMALKFRWENTAKVLLLLAAHGQVVHLCYVSGIKTSQLMFFPVCFAIAWLIFPPNHKRFAMISNIFTILCLQGVFYYEYIVKGEGLALEARKGAEYIFTNPLLAYIGLFYIMYSFTKLVQEKESKIIFSKHVSDALLHSVLPESVVRRIKSGERKIADYVDQCSVIFVDIVGFTKYSETTNADQIIWILDSLFSSIDRLCLRYQAEKIKTIGDAYMIAIGLNGEHEDSARTAVDLASEILQNCETRSLQENIDIRLRVGIHTGPVIAGVIGHNKFAYDIWGATVNKAARLQVSAEPGTIHLSQETATQIGDLYPVKKRSQKVELKGIGPIQTFYIDGHREEERAG